MIVECHSCGATYNISDEKIRGRRVRVRCKSCNEGIIVDGTRVDSDEATRVYSPNFEPGLYAARVHDEATRVMAPSGPDLRATASNDEWTVNIGESDQRTMDLAELISSYTGGLIPDDALVWREGMDDWLPIREMPELKAAIDSNEATHVVSPAMAVRAPRRAAGDRAVAHQMEPSAEPPPRATMASLSEFSEPVAPVAPRAPAPAPAPVAPRAPAPAPAPVARAERAPSARPAPVERPVAAARVRESRAAGGDLFGNIEAAGAEEALLGSSALSQYDEKPIGARNESSVLFSLDALKAGARRGSSAPPRMPSNPPQTAADILGMTAGGALPGMSASGSLLSAPAVEAPPVSPYAPTTPPRSKMDTLPPMMRPRRELPLPAIAVAAAIIVGGIAFFMVRARLSQPRIMEAPPVQSAAAARPTATEEPTTVVAKAAEPEPPPATATAAPEAPPPPETAAPPPAAPVARPASAGRVQQGDGVTAPVIPTKPQPASTPTSLEAAMKAMRPDKSETATKPAAEKGAGTEKVVLAEEPGSEGETAEKAEEPPKPPFDTAAAKAALETASSSAASCKKDDGPTGRGKVQVTFSPNGRATSANVIEGPFGGTPVGGCIAKIFRGAKVPAFSGDPVTVAKSFTIPE